MKCIAKIVRFVLLTNNKSRGSAFESEYMDGWWWSFDLLRQFNFQFALLIIQFQNDYH